MNKMSRTKKIILGLLLVPALLFGSTVTVDLTGNGGKNGEVPVVSGSIGDPSQWGLKNGSYVVATSNDGTPSESGSSQPKYP